MYLSVFPKRDPPSGKVTRKAQSWKRCLLLSQSFIDVMDADPPGSKKPILTALIGQSLARCQPMPRPQGLTLPPLFSWSVWDREGLYPHSLNSSSWQERCHHGLGGTRAAEGQLVTRDLVEIPPRCESFVHDLPYYGQHLE